jgi:hypothetical protein
VAGGSQLPRNRATPGRARVTDAPGSRLGPASADSERRRRSCGRSHASSRTQGGSRSRGGRRPSSAAPSSPGCSRSCRRSRRRLRG